MSATKVAIQMPDVEAPEWMTTGFTNLGSSNSSSVGRGVTGEDGRVALCVTANPALASHRVDSKMRSSPSEPASGSWVSAWQLAETVVAAWQGALTTAAAAVVAAVAVASCVGCDGQRSTSQTCRALKASAASKLRLSTQCCYTVLLTILLSTLPASLAAR